MTLGLTISSLLAFVLISRTSVDPLPVKMRMTRINVRAHTALCTQFQWANGALNPLQSLWTHSKSFPPYVHIYPLFNLYCCLLACFLRECWGHGCTQETVVTQGACSLVERDGLVHRYLVPE